jgi:2-polyprenyl-6-methoxyphenol hydroxylase-like FAD-dependent oxidoreductase
VIATGETYILTGEALVAADGVDSLVRSRLGIALEGEQGIHHFVNCYFHANIEPTSVTAQASCFLSPAQLPPVCCNP